MPGPTTDVSQLIGVEADVARRQQQEEEARAHARANGLDEDKTVQFAQYYGRLPLTPNEKANLTPVPSEARRAPPQLPQPSIAGLGQRINQVSSRLPTIPSGPVGRYIDAAASSTVRQFTDPFTEQLARLPGGVGFKQKQAEHEATGGPYSEPTDSIYGILGGLGPEAQVLGRAASLARPTARMALEGAGASARAALESPSLQVGLHDVGTLARGLTESEAGGGRSELLSVYRQLVDTTGSEGIYPSVLPTKAAAYAKLQAQVLADFIDLKKSLGEPVLEGQPIERGVGVTNRSASPATGKQADALGTLYSFLKDNAPRAKVAEPPVRPATVFSVSKEVAQHEGQSAARLVQALNNRGWGTIDTHAGETSITIHLSEVPKANDIAAFEAAGGAVEHILRAEFPRGSGAGGYYLTISRDRGSIAKFIKSVKPPSPTLPYGMTKEQYAAAVGAITPEERQLAAVVHEDYINNALNEGKTVPQNVLDQYPEQKALPRPDLAQTAGLHENAQIEPISPADVAAYRQSLSSEGGGGGISKSPYTAPSARDLALRLQGTMRDVTTPRVGAPLFTQEDISPSFGSIHPKTQRLFNVITNLGLPQQNFEQAFGLQSLTTPTANTIMNRFNGLRGFADDVLRLAAPVRQHFLYGQQYEGSQHVYVAARLVALQRLATDTFVSSVLKDFSYSKPMMSLRAVYKGGITELNDKLVGLLVHAYENPEAYSLTPEQSKAVAQADMLLKQDLEFTRHATGMDIGTVKQNYIPHMVRSETGIIDHTAISALLGQVERARPGFTRQRLAPTLEDLSAVVDRLNAENPTLKLYVVTDYNELMAQRLAASASMRADALFLRGLTRETGGWLITPGNKEFVSPGFSIFQHKGQNWAVRTEFMDDLTKRIFAPQYAHDVDRYASSAITALRDVLLNLDLSPSVGIQGLISLQRNPVGAFSAWKQAFQMRMTDHGNAMWLAMNVEGLMDASLHGLQLRYLPADVDSLLFTSLGKGPMERLPGIKQINEFQLNTLSLIYKYEMYKRNVSLLQLSRDLPIMGRLLQYAPAVGDAVVKLAGLGQTVTDVKLKRIAADATNNWLGGLNMAKIHIHPGSSNLHKLVLLTEGWTRALIGTHITALKPGVEGDLARGLLLQDYLLTAGVLAGLGYLLHQEVEIDPRSQQFGRLRVGNTTVVIDPRAATTRMVARLIGGIPEEENFAGDNAATQRLGALQWWLTSRASQPLSMTTNVVQGTDYLGRRISNPAVYVLSNLMPVALQNIAQTAQMGLDKQDVATTAAFSFAGMNVNPTPRTQQLTDLATGKYAGVIAQQRVDEHNPNPFTGKYNELSPASRGFLNQTPEGRKINQAFGTTDAQLARIETEQFHDVQLIRDNALAQGRLNDRPYNAKRWRDDHTMLELQRVGSKLFIEDVKRAKPSTPEGKALEGYYDLAKSFGLVLKPDTKVEVDYDAVGFTDARESYLSSLPPALSMYVENNLHPSATPKEREFFADEKTLRPYFDVLKKTLAEAGDTRLWQDFQQSGLPEQAAMRRGEDAGKIRLYEQQQTRLRDIMRLQDPAVATAVKKWGFAATETPQGLLPSQHEGGTPKGLKPRYGPDKSSTPERQQRSGKGGRR